MAVPADQPVALSGIDSKTDIENMGSVPLPPLVIKRDKDDKKTKQFVNNPFYEAFRKK